jgi:hypothetical protein
MLAQNLMRTLDNAAARFAFAQKIGDSQFK